MLLVWPRTDGWWRWLFVALAVIMPIGVAGRRMYRGMHHPWDLFGSVVLAAGWLTVCYLVIRPNANQPRAAAVADVEAEPDPERPAAVLSDATTSGK